MDTVDHLIRLREAIPNRDFGTYRFLCHKMWPMFLQLGAPQTLILELQRIDRWQEENESPAPSLWQDLIRIAERIEPFLEDLRQKYLSQE